MAFCGGSSTPAQVRLGTAAPLRALSSSQRAGLAAVGWAPAVELVTQCRLDWPPFPHLVGMFMHSDRRVRGV